MTIRLLLALAAICVALAQPPRAEAVPPETGASERAEARAALVGELLDQWDADAQAVADALGARPDADALEELRALLERQLSLLPDLRTRTEAELAPLREQLTALGPVTEGAAEPPAIAENRAKLTAAIGEVEGRLRRAAQVEVRAGALIQQIYERRREIFTETMLTHGPTVLAPGTAIEGLGSIYRSTRTLVTETGDRLARLSFDATLLARFVIPVLLVGGGLVVALAFQRFAIRKLLGLVTTATPQSRRVLVAVGVTVARLVLPTLALGLAIVGLMNSELLGPTGEALLIGVARTTALVIGAYALGGAFFAPGAPMLRLSVLDDAGARSAHRRLMALAGVVGADRAVVAQGDALGLSIEALSLLNTVTMVAGGVILWLVVNILTRAPRAAEPSLAAAATGEETASEATDPGSASAPLVRPVLTRAARLIGRISAVAAPMLALGGYYAASRFAFLPVVFSGALIGVCFLLFYVVQELVERVVAPAAGEGETRRLRLIPVIVGFVLFCGALPVLALIWGADVADLASAWRRVLDGFRIGDVTISPSAFLGFLLVFSLGYLLTRMAQGILARSVLPLTGLDTGGRAAVNAGVGYVGIIVSTLLAISTAGLDLSNLAIVAGALSVGIGFGLQNIVNNFVSGIILLIERPIKAGDWIDLPSGSGYVRQVNVRSTEIETFDRSTLFVPNSELISGPVTNWTHSNLNGRVIIPVGVAYGSDLRKVERILLEVGRAHPNMLRRPGPMVLFRSFGASSLEFELRGIIRDVNSSLSTTSELNFEIARRFAEEGIEIPFAQSDVTIRNLDEVLAALRERERGAPRLSPGPRAAGGDA